MDSESQKKSRPTKRNLAIVCVVTIVVVVGTMTVLGSVFGSYACFGPCGTRPDVVAASCYSVNKTCQLVMAGLTRLPGRTLDAIACYFIQNNGPVQGTLSSSPNGSPSPVAIPLNTPVDAFCSYPGAPSVGHQVSGSVSFSSGASVPFASTWQ